MDTANDKKAASVPEMLGDTLASAEREGDKMSTQTEAHESTTCERGEQGKHCSMCEWANAQEAAQEVARAQEIDDFHYNVWRTAPQSMRIGAEAEAAEYFYRLGLRDGRTFGVVQGNEALSEILKPMKNRGLV